MSGRPLRFDRRGRFQVDHVDEAFFSRCLPIEFSEERGSDHCHNRHNDLLEFYFHLFFLFSSLLQKSKKGQRRRIPRPLPFSLRYVGVFKLRGGGGYATLSQDVTNALVVLLPILSPRIVTVRPPAHRRP